jgi:hypothetical protein
MINLMSGDSVGRSILFVAAYPARTSQPWQARPTSSLRFPKEIAFQADANTMFEYALIATTILIGFLPSFTNECVDG